jgi:hypothetical protein
MMKVKKVLIYYAIFVLGIALFLLVDNFVGLLILGILIALNFDKLKEMVLNLKEKLDKKIDKK